jgi:hypothetical protein
MTSSLSILRKSKFFLIFTCFLISGSLQTLSMISGVGMIFQLGATAQIIVRALTTIG